MDNPASCPPHCLLGMGFRPSTVPATPYHAQSPHARKAVSLSLGHVLCCIHLGNSLSFVSLLPTQRPRVGHGGNHTALDWQLHMQSEGSQVRLRLCIDERKPLTHLWSSVFWGPRMPFGMCGVWRPWNCLFTRVGVAGLWEGVSGWTFLECTTVWVSAAC